MWKVRFFTDDRDKKPVQDFFDTQTKAERARFDLVVTKHLEPNGTATRGDILHKIDDLYQARVRECRILMYIPDDEPRTFVLLHAFPKKSNETPPKEIEKAQNNKLKDQLQRANAQRKKL